jgi:phage gpG-like protein
MASQQKVRLKIPRGIKPADRERLGKEIINFIRSRTKADNVDKKNQDFAAYSESYAEEKGSERVNLTDTGDMLDNLSLLRSDSGFVTIGYEEGYDGMGKVEGNRKGTYGNKKPVVEGRDFLGITEADLNDIVEQFGNIDERDAEIEQSIVEEARGLSRGAVEQLRQSSLRRQLGLDDGDF